jgi:hypothetical protein
MEQRAGFRILVPGAGIFVFGQQGGGVMRRFFQDIVLFSCLAAFVTGVVIAAATLFG